MKVIITDCDHDNIEIEKKIFADAGIEMELKHAISEDEVIEQCQDAEILIVQYAKITRKVMEHCPRLKFVVRYGVGVDTIDVAAAAEFGVQIGNVPGLRHERGGGSRDCPGPLHDKRDSGK